MMDMIVSTFAISSVAGGLYNEPCYSSVNRYLKTECVQYVAEFSGEINQNAVNTFLDMIQKTQPNSIYINSDGGDELAAIRLGTYLRDNNISVVARVQCLSACVQYVLLGNRDPSVANGTIIGFHQSSIAINLWSRPYISFREDYRHLYETSQEIADATRRLLDNDIKISYLVNAFYSVGPICIAPPTLASRGNLRIIFANQFIFPSRFDMNELGIRVNEGWPNTEPEFSEYITQSRTELQGIIFKRSSVIPTSAVPDCPAGM